MSSEPYNVNLNTPELLRLMATFREVAAQFLPEIQNNVSLETSDFKAECSLLIPALRQTAAQFPPEISDDLFLEIDSIEAELQKLEQERDFPQIIKRLIAVAAWILG
jgi:hypothetical protein